MNNQKLLRQILQFIAISAILFLTSCNKKTTTEPDLLTVPVLISPNDGAVNQPVTLELSWTLVDSATGYFCEVSESDDFTETFLADSIEDTSIEITGLSNNTVYYWHVSAYDDFGSSEYSAAWHFTTEPGGSGSGSCIDIDGNTYETVTIGSQEWMAENLKVTHYRNGDAIPTAYSNSEWGGLSIGAYAVYPADDDDISLATCNGDCAEVYGNLYNWYAVEDDRGVCPEGWHVPTDEEWTQLENYLGAYAGGKLKDTGTIEAGTGLWYSPNTGATNETGFTALPGGFRDGFGGYYSQMGTNGYFWSSTAYSSSFAWFRILFYYDSIVNRNNAKKQSGLLIRCIRPVE